MAMFWLRPAALGSAGLCGWVLGGVAPPPVALTQALNPSALRAQAEAGLTGLDWAELSALVPQERLASLRAEAVGEAAQAGALIPVEAASPEALAEAMPEELAKAPSPPSLGPAFEQGLSLCPGMAVTNAPPVDDQRRVRDFAPVVAVSGVTLAVNPTRGACLSSGFGARGGRTHKGLDYHAANGGPILAAAAGTVLERKYRDDFGNMLLIDHGGGVHTRYAHLSAFARGVTVGAAVSAGQEIGLMGNTAAFPLPIHLHYELLVGDYANPKGSFGLEAKDPFGFPAAN